MCFFAKQLLTWSFEPILVPVCLLTQVKASRRPYSSSGTESFSCGGRQFTASGGFTAEVPRSLPVPPTLGGGWGAERHPSASNARPRVKGYDSTFGPLL